MTSAQLGFNGLAVCMAVAALATAFCWLRALVFRRQQPEALLTHSLLAAAVLPPSAITLLAASLTYEDSGRVVLLCRFGFLLALGGSIGAAGSAATRRRAG